MGMIINIDQALELRSDYNILKEPLHAMLKAEQEAWERENPIDMMFVRSTLASFQETYTSSIGFDHAFAETSDYAVGPIFNTAEGFSATYRTRTFQGGFIITQQVLEDRQLGKVKDDANAFMKRWHADIVEYAIASIAGGFGVDYFWGAGNEQGKSRLRLYSADTVDGDIHTLEKNPLFTKNHKTVKREGQEPYTQSNLYYVADGDLDILGNDAGKISKLADVINVVITNMENYRDDNGKRAGVTGAKDIVFGNDARLKAAIETALATDMFKQGETCMPNPAYKRATAKTSPYFLDIPQCANGKGFFIIDKAYNAQNHGLEFTERIPLTLEANETKRPKGITYDGRQRFDINCASWRGVAYVMLGTPTGGANDWNYQNNFTRIEPTATIVTPVTVVGTVKTTEV